MAKIVKGLNIIEIFVKLFVNLFSHIILNSLQCSQIVFATVSWKALHPQK